MKKSLAVTLFIVFFFISLRSFAQTNTFPASGNVGIGTIYPAGALQIDGPSPSVYGTYTDTTGFFAIRGNLGTWIMGWAGAAGSEDISIGTQDNTGARTLTLATGGYARMRIQANGNVGIGTISPAARLNIVGTTGANGGGADIYANAENSFIGIDAGQTRLGMIKKYGYYPVIAGGSTTPIIFGHLSTDQLLGNINTGTLSQQVVISPTGNIGIGTISPAYPLTIAGTGSVVGIDNSSVFMAKNASGNYEAFLWPRWSDNITYMNYGSAGFNIRNNSSSTTMFFTNSGSIGIGTSSPATKCDVDNGSVYGGLRVANNNGETWLSYPGDGHNYIRGTTIIADGGGNVLIGKTSQTNTSYRLDVNGNLRANEVVVNTTGADFVFDSTYQLPSLSRVEDYIRQNKHLPEIPSSRDIQANGVSLGENQMKLLQKVEELTLYVIAQNKEIQTLKKQVEELKKK